MKISAGSIVSIHYTLTGDNGEVLDSSREREPLQYEQGAGAIIPGLEQALEGRASGDTLQVTLEPEQAYGEYNQDMVQSVPRTAFNPGDPLEPGMQFRVQSDQGVMMALVKEVGVENVTLDFNHPLAGARLHFDVDVMEVSTGEADDDAPRIIV